MNIFAQDIITKHNGEEIQVKVINVNDKEINYIKWSNMNGPTYTIPVSEVFMIKYENGTKDSFVSEQKSDNSYAPEQKYAADMTMADVILGQTAAPKQSSYDANETDKPYRERITYFAQSGLTVNSINNNIPGEYRKAVVGWLCGIGVDLPVTKKRQNTTMLSIRTSLLFIQKGVRAIMDTNEYYESQKNNPIYAEIPVNLAFSVGVKNRLILYGGPYLAFGIGGKHKTDMYLTIFDSKEHAENEINFFEDYANSFDFGLSFGFLFDFKHVFIGCGGDIGLLNVFEYSEKLTNNLSLVVNIGVKL